MSRGPVLVVDDNPVMVETVSDILELEGWSVRQAFDGHQAVEVARSEALSAILMDIRMPGMNGVEALEILKAERPNIPVIVMTAFSITDLIHHAVSGNSLQVLDRRWGAETIAGRLDGDTGPILIADDDPALLDALEHELCGRTRSCHRLSDLDEALQTFEAGGDIVVLVDAVVPRMSPDTVYAIYQVSGPVAVILSKALGEGAVSQAESIRAQVFGVVRKPFSPAQVLTMLDEAHNG